jgi:hypothetical protein
MSHPFPSPISPQSQLEIASHDDFFIYNTTEFKPFPDPGSKTIVHTHRSSALVHTTSDILVETIVSNLPSLFVSGANQKTSAVRCSVTLTSSLMFFVDGSTKTAVAGKKKGVYLHILCEWTPTRDDGSESKPAPSQAITFRTVSPAEAGNFGSSGHAAAVAKAIADAKDKGGQLPTEVTGLSGSITLTSGLFGCTEITLVASIGVQAASLVESEAAVDDENQTTKRMAATVGGIASGRGAALMSAYSAKRVLNHVIAAVHKLYNRFADPGAVDEATFSHFETEVLPKAPPMITAETNLVNESLRYDDQDTTEFWSRYPKTIGGPVAYFHKKTTGSSGWAKGVAEIDASAPRIVSWVWLSLSNMRVQDHLRKNGRLLRMEIPVPDSHSKIMLAVQKFPGKLANRVYSTMFTWRKESDGSFTIGFADIKDCERFGTAVKEASDIIATHKDAVAAVRGSTRGVWRIEPRAPNVCLLSLVSQGTVGGSIPLMFVNAMLKKNIAIVDRLRLSFERKEKDVDSEVREALPNPPNIEDLSDEQKELLASCLTLASRRGNLVKVGSPSPFVGMSMAYSSPQKGERSVALGRGEVVVDTSAHRALGWYFEFCSRERIRFSAEEGNLARICVQRLAPHDATYATVKRFPIFLSDREFVFRAVAAQDSGKYIVANRSTDRYFTVDYGTNFKAVRGFIAALFVIEPLGPNSCRCEFLQIADAGGFLPVAVVNRMVPLQLTTLVQLRNAFQRDEEIDKEARNDLVRIIRDEPQDYTVEENDLLYRVASKLDNLKQEDLKGIDSPDPLVEMNFIIAVIGSSSGAIVTATTTVDASIEECAAWDLLKLSREQLNRSKSRDILLDRTSSHHSIFHFIKDLNVVGFMPREWIFRSVWKWQDAKTLLTAYEHFPDQPGFEVNPKYLRGISSMVFYKYEKLPPLGGMPQTRASFTQQVDLGGAIPRFVVDKAGVKQLMYLSTMRKRFDKSLEIDGVNRASIVEMINNHADEEYTEEEESTVADGISAIQAFKANPKKRQTSMKHDAIAKHELLVEEKNKATWGLATTIVHASAEEVLAFQWHTKARNQFKSDTLEKTYFHETNHSRIEYVIKKLPAAFSNRDFMGLVVWKRISDEKLVMVSDPREDAELRPRTRDVVRGKFPLFLQITRLAADKCQLEFMLQLDIGIVVPRKLLNFYVEYNLKRATHIRQYFQAMRGLALWDADDGTEIGEIMMLPSRAEKHRNKDETKMEARIRELFGKNKGLEEIGTKYEFFRTMMVRVLENKLRPSGDINTNLLNLGAMEGRKIGAGLAMAMAGNLTSEAAVDEWILRYPALKELDRAEIWFRPMLNVVARRILSDVGWGLKMRVAIGAFLSLVDMGSDINVILLYMGSPGTEGFGWVMLWMVVASLGLQLLTVYSQHRKNKWLLAREVLVVLTCLKAPVDAYRVIVDAEPEEHNAFDPKAELVVTKCAEMVVSISFSLPFLNSSHTR